MQYYAKIKIIQMAKYFARHYKQDDFHQIHQIYKIDAWEPQDTKQRKEESYFRALTS